MLITSTTVVTFVVNTSATQKQTITQPSYKDSLLSLLRSEKDLNEPHKLNQAEWSDLVQDFNLPKKAELLASSLHQWILLLHGVKNTVYRTREKNVLHFFENKEHVDARIDTKGLMNFMNISYDPNNWRCCLQTLPSLF
ncbi:hypothetical protein TNIN_324421 [Trichonephila inaurata madagascariensis]|uniref:Uncharacterized protein n=1 Tax=Trichonephila inaurata madagascariensis TaxID=2747483 RepID=A0A8X6XRB9_9ARAC|nr:hypothetical protein TNIN_324421 [Trichonephila inaurata madagascariensis]